MPNPTNSAPVMPTPAPPAQAPADLQSQVQSAPNIASDPGSPVVQKINEANTALQRASDIAGKPVPTGMPAPTGRHAGLVAMIQGLTLGMDAFGKSLATEGREGGVAEVQQIQQQQQTQRIQAAQEARAERNAELQQQLTAADTAMKQGQNMLLLATLPTDLAAKNLALTKEQQSITAGQQAIAENQAAFMSQYGVTPDQFSAIMSGTATDPSAANNMRSFAEQKVNAYSQILGADDPTVQNAQKALADPNASARDLFTAVSGVTRAVALKGAVTEAKIKQGQAAQGEEQSNPKLAALANMEKNPTAMAGQNSSAAVAQLSGMLASETDPALKYRESQLLGMAKAAHTAWVNDIAAKDQLQQSIAQGDPKVAGELLASNTLTVQDLKLRNATPQFIEHAVNQARVLTGGKYNAVEAEGYQHVANSDANTVFFGNVNSLVQPGGTLDQLSAIGKKISPDDFKLLNKTKNWVSLETGGTSIAGYMATLVGVVDDYAKVMGGGAGSDAGRAMVLRIIDPSLSGPQRESAITGVKDAVNSQKSARIGNNPFLAAMYGTTPAERQQPTYNRPANVSKGAVLMQAPGGTPHWIEPANIAAAKALGAVPVE